MNEPFTLAYQYKQQIAKLRGTWRRLCALHDAEHEASTSYDKALSLTFAAMGVEGTLALIDTIVAQRLPPRDLKDALYYLETFNSYLESHPIEGLT